MLRKAPIRHNVSAHDDTTIAVGVTSCLLRDRSRHFFKSTPKLLPAGRKPAGLARRPRSVGTAVTDGPKSCLSCAISVNPGALLQVSMLSPTGASSNRVSASASEGPVGREKMIRSVLTSTPIDRGSGPRGVDSQIQRLSDEDVQCHTEVFGDKSEREQDRT